MMDNSEYSFTQTNMENTLKVKTEPIEEEVDEILPVLPERLNHVKPECCEVTADNNTNCSKDQENTVIKINNSNILQNKTLINLNGVFYFLEKIPETESVVQKEQAEMIVPQVQKRIYGASGTCPKCGKVMKQPRNLKRHMQTCYNDCTFTCPKCNYRTSSGHYWLQHGKQCGNTKSINKIQRSKFNRKVNCLCVCLTCNTSTLLYSEICSKCGSKHHWKCKFCNKIFQTWVKARHHLRTKCKPNSYYHCRMCDYRHVVKYYTKKHIVRSHPECKFSSNFIEQRIIQTDADTAKHVCSLCSKKFEDAPSLNKHIFVCRKYQLYSRVICKKVTTNEDISQTDSGSKLELKSYKQFITRHCETCNEDCELENIGISIKKSCINCLSTLAYKCKKCGKLLELYNSLVKHVKAICNQEEQFKCVQCDFVTCSMSRLTEHNKKHGDISATCTNCGSFFINSSSFKKHIKRCGLVTILQCDMCPYKSTTKISLRKHIKSHASPPALSNSINNLDSHFAKIPPRIQPYCTNCGRHQTTSHRLKSCKLCNRKLQFTCSTCNKMHSIDDPDVCEHVKNYLELFSFECKYCGKSFSNKDKYKLHENSCGKIKRYRCKLCSYSTRYEIFFRLHNRKAHQIRYKGRRFLNEDSKKIEMKIAKVLHLCQYCSYETRYKALLQKHLKIHLEKNEASSSLSHQIFNKETSNKKFDGDSKLNLQCKVVLTRLLTHKYMMTNILEF